MMILKWRDHALDRVVGLALGRQDDARIVEHDRAGGDLLQRLLEDPHRLVHLLDAHDVAVEVVALRADRHVEVEAVVDQVRVVLADVVGEARRAQPSGR